MDLRLPRVLSSILLFLFSGALYSGETLTPNDTLVDVLPLSIGNQWTYRYFTIWDYAPAGTPYELQSDSGRVTYFISARESNADSTRWQVQVQRDIARHQILYQLGTPILDTTYVIRDSSSFDLIENLQGQHQLYRSADPYLIRTDIFPFTRNYVDTTRIYRFRSVGPGDTVAFTSWIRPPPGAYFRSSFTFKKDLGLVRNIYNSGTIDVYTSNEHVLLSSIITAVPEQRRSTAPSSVVLYQNYPNPFNPSTTITYMLSNESPVMLSVFDALGRRVTTMIDKYQAPGFRTVRWNGNNFPSGVYFYQLKVGSYVKTGKMLLAK